MPCTQECTFVNPTTHKRYLEALYFFLQFYVLHNETVVRIQESFASPAFSVRAENGKNDLIQKDKID